MENDVQAQLEESVDMMQEVYVTVVDFLVGYSFQILGALIVLAAGFVVGGWVSRALLRVQERRNVDVTLRQFIASTVKIIVLVMFLIIALSQLGISITPLIAAIGGLAVGASFAIQGPVSNYGAGLAIILTRMFRVGDTVTVQGCSGLVEEISLATTHLRAEDGEEIVIPNKHIVGEIHRNSKANRIVEGRIGVAYAADPEQAVRSIRDAVAALADVATTPAPQIGIGAFSEYAILIDYRVWVPTGRYFELLHEVNGAVYRALAAAEIPIAYVQREVRLHQE